MPNYRAMEAGLQGFFSGRDIARKDKLYNQQEDLFRKQQQEEAAMKQQLSGIIANEYKVDPSTLSGLGVDDLSKVYTLHTTKKKEEQEKVKQELDAANTILSEGIKMIKPLRGPARKAALQDMLGAVMPMYQKHGYFKNIDQAEFMKKLDIADDKPIGDIVNNITSVVDGVQSGVFGKEKGHTILNKALADVLQNIEDPDMKKNLIQLISDEKKRLEPKTEPINEMSLIKKSLAGDPEATAILNKKQQMGIELAGAKATSAIGAKLGTIDIPGTAQAVLDGRETIENVKNTFGVPIQETIRKEVLKQDPSFNFNQPRAAVKGLESSVSQQQKNRGMMGSFVKNINGQVDKLEKISQDLVKRIGVRALDLPRRELLTRFIGSGQEQILAAYMKEVSAEIAKLAQGSAASIAQLPESNRIEWEKIHDVNLSLRELMIVLNGTREMANIRLKSVDDEIKSTMDRLKNVRQPREEQSSAPQSKFKILKVE